METTVALTFIGKESFINVIMGNDTVQHIRLVSDRTSA